MSGIEAAGIALAVFPLCIELVKLYQSGAGTIEQMRHHQQALRSFQRQLGMEYTKFLNSLCEIFDDEITEQDCIRIFRDPTGNEAQERLEARLSRPNAAESFIDAILDLRDELDELKNTLPALTLDSTSGSLMITSLRNKNIIADMTAIEHIKYVQAEGRNQKTLKRVGKNLKKRFTFAFLQQELSKRMQKIREINEDIHTLAEGARRSATNRPTNRKSLSSKKEHSAIQNYYQRVREGAQSICNSIRTGILTPHGCHDREHGISLCLELRDAGGNAPPNPRSKVSRATPPHNSTLHFRIMFSLVDSKPSLENTSIQLAPKWKELEVEPVDNDEDIVDENKQRRQNDQSADRLIPEIHLNDFHVDRSIQPKIPGPSYTDGNIDPGHSASNIINTCTASRQDQLERAHPLPQRPATPTRQVRKSGMTKKVARFLGFDHDESGSACQELNTLSGTSQPPSRQPTPEPSVRSLNKATRNLHGTPDTETHDMIHDICRKIEKSTVATRHCLGLLKGDTRTNFSGTRIAHRYHRLWSMPHGGCFDLANQLQCSAAWDSDPVPLCSLFLTHKPDIHSRGSSVSMQHRLLLGIKLASSVIQLHRTLWLNELWSKQDIVFFIDPRTSDPILETPLVLQKVTNSPGSTACQGITMRDANSKILFSLGILLCELWYWRRLEDFHFCREILQPIQVPENYSQWSSLMLTGAAHEALKGLHAVAPKVYCDVVATCFSNDVPTEDQTFVSFVWDGVLSPLKANLSYYKGEKH